MPPVDYYFRTTPYFETGSDKYAWLNKILAVGVGQVDLSKGWVGYKVYEVGGAFSFGVSISCGACQRAIADA